MSQIYHSFRYLFLARGESRPTPLPTHEYLIGGLEIADLMLTNSARVSFSTKIALYARRSARLVRSRGTFASTKSDSS